MRYMESCRQRLGHSERVVSKKRSNDTHESKTDPEARLARKSGGHESKLAYCGRALTLVPPASIAGELSTRRHSVFL